MCESPSKFENGSGKVHLPVSGDRDLWDQHGVVDEVLHGEGERGEQSDALKPALLALSQHNASEALQHRLLPEERVFASLNVADAVCAPDRVPTIHSALQVSRQDPGAHPTRGDVVLRAMPPSLLPSKISAFSALLFVSPISSTVSSPRPPQFTPLSLTKITSVPDLQPAWLLLLFCAQT